MSEFNEFLNENTYENGEIIEKIFSDEEMNITSVQAVEEENSEASQPKDKKPGRFVFEAFDWLEAVAYALVTIFILFAFIFRVVGVDGSSMVPTLHDKDWLVISHLNFEPERRDIIVVTRAQEVNKPLIKRVIGVEGDEIDIDFDEGIVYVNGAAQEESYINAPTYRRGNMQFPLTVPEGYVFVMGDNRNESLDSRFSEVGFIDERYIMGKVVTRLYPMKKING